MLVIAYGQFYHSDLALTRVLNQEFSSMNVLHKILNFLQKTAKNPVLVLHASLPTSNRSIIWPQAIHQRENYKV